MKEDFLHYIWKYRLIKSSTLTTSQGQAVTVVHPGTHNTNAGPDFFNAKVEIDGTLWVGNIEIHVNASDWFKHNHDTDPAYDNVILHLVGNADIDEGTICRKSGEAIPQSLLCFNSILLSNYELLSNNDHTIPCHNHLGMLDKFTVSNWLQTVIIERMEQKICIVLDLLKQNNQSWEESYYQHLASCFGLAINTLPFELLAKSLPLLYLGKHKTNLLQIEAMLFGQAGMLNNDRCNDDYFLSLKKEYRFLSSKFGLSPIESHLWQFLRLRPANFPTIRLAQFAQLIHRSSALFSQIIDLIASDNKNEAINKISKIFDLSTSDYWETHYTFGKTSNKKIKRTGKLFINSLFINNIIPFAFARGHHYNNENLKNSALELLEKLKAENNAVVDNWKSAGITAKTAYETQALIHLKKNYCDRGKCLLCRIGCKVVSIV